MQITLHSRILKKYIKNEDLEEAFELWRSSNLAEKYWTKKIRNSAVLRSRRKAAEHVKKAVLDESNRLGESIDRDTSLPPRTTPPKILTLQKLKKNHHTS